MEVKTDNDLLATVEKVRSMTPGPTVEPNSQHWQGMDGTTAFHLIQRHADNWADVGLMMGEWLAANTTPRMAFCPACFVEVTAEQDPLAQVLREVAATFSLDYEAVRRAVGSWGTSTVSTPEYQQEQREKNQRARDLLDGLARKGAE